MSRVLLLGGEDLVKRQVFSASALRPMLRTGSSLNEMIAGNATLQKDEWERVDERVNEVMRERLTVADDLRGRGLVQPLNIGTITRITERLEAFEAAQVSFDGDTDPQKDKTQYQQDIIAVPVISKGFDIGFRQLDASRTLGQPIDTTAAELAARSVRDQLQNIITNGFAHSPTGGAIPGLVTAASRIPFTIATAWTTAAVADIVDDVTDMLQLAYNANLFGPFILYIPKNYWGIVQKDYSTAKGDRTLLERFEAFADIGPGNVRPNDMLPAGSVVLVQMTRDIIDLNEAWAVTTVQWEKNPFLTHFRVLMIGGPQIKRVNKSGAGVTTAAGAGQTVLHGIVHGS